MSVERNAPCPCGSGLKYKKCCLRKDRGAAPAVVRPSPAPPPAPGITPYTIARLVEYDGSEGTGGGGHREAGAGDPRTISGVGALATEEIEERLVRLGVPYARDAFAGLAEGRESAWSIGQVWIRRSGVRRDRDEDFICLAACELWKRLLPDRPSVEMIDDWMQEGYGHDLAGRHGEAARIWWEVWRWLHPRFTPAMRTMRAAEAIFAGTQSIFNWCQDFELCLGNASRDDPAHAPRGKRYCTEWLAQFSDEDGHMQLGFLRALAGFLFRLGETAAGEATLQGLVERWPEDVWGYIALADAYGHVWTREPGPALDLPRALGYLEQGLAVAVDPDDRETILERMEILGAGPPE